MWKCSKCGTKMESFELECRNCGYDKELSEYNEEVDFEFYNTTGIKESKKNCKRNNIVGKWIDSISMMYLIISSIGVFFGALYLSTDSFKGEFSYTMFFYIIFVSAFSIFTIYIGLRVVSEVLHLLQNISDNTGNE